jgi:acyl carrier protein
MDMSNPSQPTFEQLALIIETKLGIPHESVRPETTLKDIEMDSLAILEVMLAAEKQFGAEMPDEVSLDSTAEDLYQLVVAAVAGSRA